MICWCRKKKFTKAIDKVGATKTYVSSLGSAGRSNNGKIELETLMRTGRSLVEDMLGCMKSGLQGAQTGLRHR